MKYTEKHYGQGEGTGKRILNPQTILEVYEGGFVEMELIHEAAISKISSEQLIKLMSLGLSEKEAEDKILEGFLK